MGVMYQPGAGGGAGGGMMMVGNWNELPPGPSDGDEAYVTAEEIAVVAQDGEWLPRPQVGGRTLTLLTSRCIDLADELADLIAAGFDATGVTKTAGSPLVIDGTFSSSRITAVMPTRYLMRIDYTVTSGQGWIAVANSGPTRRLNVQHTATELREANGSSSTTEGPWATTGPLYILLDWTGATPVVSTWAPGMKEHSIPTGTIHAPDDLEGYSNADNANTALFVGGYSGTARWGFTLKTWEVS